MGIERQAKVARSGRARRAGRWAMLVAGLMLWPPGSAWAGAPTDQLRASVDRVIRVLEDPALRPEARTAERRAAIRREANQIFDFEETAKRALGRHWQELTEADRREFVALFADLLEHAYVSKIERYSGEKIVYAGDSAEGEGARVKTRFVTAKGEDIPVEYRMRRRDDRWLVYDVNVEGVSLVASYRSQFDRIIRSSSYRDLVARMKSRQDGFTAPGGSGDRAGAPRS